MKFLIQWERTCFLHDNVLCVPQLTNALLRLLFIGIGKQQESRKQACYSHDSCIRPPAPEQDTRQSSGTFHPSALPSVWSR